MRHLKSISHPMRGLIILLFLSGVSWGQLVTNNAVINGGTYIGQNGGVILSGTAFSIDADKINGLTASGNNVINAGVFEGGMEMIVFHYGKGWGLWSTIQRWN